MNITQHPSSDYIKQETIKRLIVLHYTGGLYPGYESTLAIRDYVNVHYSIRRTGEIIQYFPEKYFAYHTGTTLQDAMDSIGIECEADGQLTRNKNQLLTWYKKVVPWKEVVKCNLFRGFQYWHCLTPAQYEALDFLIPDIRSRNPINEICTHAQKKATKLDFPPDFPGLDKYLLKVS